MSLAPEVAAKAVWVSPRLVSLSAGAGAENGPPGYVTDSTVYGAPQGFS